MLLRTELTLLLRARMAMLALILVTLLSIAAVAAGMAEVARQRDVIARIPPQQERDLAAIASWVDQGKDPGNAA